MDEDKSTQAALDDGSQGYSIMATPSVMGIQWKIQRQANKAAVGSSRRFCTTFAQGGGIHLDKLRDVLVPHSSTMHLPPWPELLQIIHRYFQSVNRLFPIYNEEAFVNLVKHEFLSHTTCRSRGLWVSLNMMLAFTLEVESTGCTTQPTVSYDWFRNAQSILPSMITSQGNLLSIQALLAMALYQQLHRNIHSANLLVTAALRSCHGLGLHTRRSTQYVSDEVREAQERVFWVACVLDQSLALVAGTAPTQNHEDIAVPFPGSRLNEGTLDQDALYFRLLCQQAVIRSKAFRYLYSAKALRQPRCKALTAIKGLNSALDAWKRHNPFFQVDISHTKHDIFTLTQRLSYCNTLILINQQCYRWDTHVADDTSIVLPYAVQICIDAAWDSIELLGTVPAWRNIDYMGVLVDYVLFAARTLSTIAVGPGRDATTAPLAQLVEVAYEHIKAISQSGTRPLPDLQSHLTLILLQTACTRLGGGEAIAHHRT